MVQRETIIRRQKNPHPRLLLGVRSSGRAVCGIKWQHGSGYVNRYNFYWGKSGTVRYRVDGKAYSNNADELLIFPPGVTMSPEPDMPSNGEYNWMTLDGKNAGTVLEHFGLKLYTPQTAGNCPVTLFTALRHALAQVSWDNQFNCEDIAYSIILKAAKSIAFGKIIHFSDPIAEKCKQIFDDEYSDHFLNIDSVAHRLQINRSRLSRIFKAAFKLPPSEYLAKLRIQSAMRLLQNSENYSIGRIAMLCGFADPAFFSRKFKAELNISPREFRKEI